MKHTTIMLLAAFVMSAVGAFAQVTNVSAAEAKKIIETNAKTIQVLDVRTPEEWKGGHLTMAKHINVNDADFATKADKLDKTKPIVVYCAAGGRSSRAASVLASKGFKTVYNVSNGGYTNLAATGLPTTTK
jgi:phage shock protein E